MLSIVANSIGAHSETIPVFMEINAKSKVYFPWHVHTTSVEPLMRKAYDCDFVKTVDDLLHLIDSNENHDVFIFNNSWEFEEEWATAVLSHWRGKVAVYHHEVRNFEVAGLAQVYAHPFMGSDRYMLPVSNMILDHPRDDNSVDARKATIVIPNWSRPTHLVFKNIPFLSAFVEANPELDFVFTGMKITIMEEARQKMKDPSRIRIIEKLDVEQLAELLTIPNTYIMPAIHPEGRYATAGLTGSIPLGVNHLCPLLVSPEIAEAYELQDAYISENLDNYEMLADKEFYAESRSKLIGYRSRRIERNRQVFNAALAASEV